MFFAGALARYEQGLAIARRLASAEPSHAPRQRDLSVSLNRSAGTSSCASRSRRRAGAL